MGILFCLNNSLTPLTNNQLADTTSLVNDAEGASISVAAARQPMEITSEVTIHISVEDISELVDINNSRIDAMQEHWCAAFVIQLVSRKI